MVRQFKTIRIYLSFIILYSFSIPELNVCTVYSSISFPNAADDSRTGCRPAIPDQIALIFFFLSKVNQFRPYKPLQWMSHLLRHGRFDISAFRSPQMSMPLKSAVHTFPELLSPVPERHLSMVRAPCPTTIRIPALESLSENTAQIRLKLSFFHPVSAPLHLPATQ